jgi:hypothetical protein
MAEAEDLKSSKCGFDPHRGHVLAGFSEFSQQITGVGKFLARSIVPPLMDVPLMSFKEI